MTPWVKSILESMSSFKGPFCEIFKKEADVKLIVVMLGVIMSNSLTDLISIQILVAPY